MSARPLITVLMPVYNARAFVADAIRSVLDQTCTDFELLVIDDGSTDGSAEVIKILADPRIVLVQHERNMGLVASLNEGIDRAKGRYIARMDADDRMLPDRLAKQLAYLEADPSFAVVAGFVELISERNEPRGTWDMDRLAATPERIRSTMPRTNCIAHPSVMMRTEIARRYRYRGEQDGAEDWDLWMRLLADGRRIGKVPEVLLHYRVHSGSIMGGAKAGMSVERRLLKARATYLRSNIFHLRRLPFNMRVLYAQLRTYARMAKLKAPVLARDAYRVITCSPFALRKEEGALRAALRTWKGHQLFLFPYLDRGGAEQVYSHILSVINDQAPLVLITGFSKDRGMHDRFAANATVIELPRLLNHPFTRKAAERRIAEHLNAVSNAVLFSSLTTTFFEVIPLLDPSVRAIWLQHAFLHQPGGNVQHKAWLKHFARVDHYGFVSLRAKAEFTKFLAAEGIAPGKPDKLLFLPNAVERTGEVRTHEKLGLLFVGRDSAEKRLDLFLAIAARLQREHPDRFRFTVVGPSKGHAPGVTFTGPIDDQARLAQIYADHDMLLLTSVREGFPMVIMEAMAQGLAVISTPVGDVPNRLDGSCAVITSRAEASTVQQEMCAAVIEMDRDRERLQELKQAALAKAKAEFSMEAFAKRYRDLLIKPAAST